VTKEKGVQTGAAAFFALGAAGFFSTFFSVLGSAFFAALSFLASFTVPEAPIGQLVSWSNREYAYETIAGFSCWTNATLTIRVGHQVNNNVLEAEWDRNLPLGRVKSPAFSPETIARLTRLLNIGSVISLRLLLALMYFWIA
jgi:hypothetical protein